MSKRDGIHQKSTNVLYDNMKWLLYSGIRIKTGSNQGAMYGWKDRSKTSQSHSFSSQSSYPFIYSEITGYAITCFSWLYSEFGYIDALSAAKDSANWVLKNKHNSSHLLVAGYQTSHNFYQKGNMSNQIYAFDNGMIMIGLLNLYKITRDAILLSAAKQVTNALIERFFDGSKNITYAVLDKSFRPTNYGSGKWSTVPGAYHSKLCLGLLELSRLTNDNFYIEISDSLCNFAQTMQKSDGHFITSNADSENITFLHPHLYACEGLIYAGIMRHNKSYYLAGLRGIQWAVEQVNSNGGLPRDTSERSEEQSDCMAQLLRLLILCRPQLQKVLKYSSLLAEKVIERLHLRLLDFYISNDEDRGGIRYQLALDSVCSWSTMFSAQALRLWSKRNKLNGKVWIDYYI